MMWRPLLVLAGLMSLSLGIAGIFLPVLPTTPFVLLTGACWVKASPRFHRWLRGHATFGLMVRNWEDRHAVPRKAKWLSSGMMTASILALLWRLPQHPWLIALVALVCLSVSIWMWRLPENQIGTK